MCSRKGYPPPNFDHLLEKDVKLSSLYSGDVSGYPSRNEAEMALLVKLVFYGFTPEQIWGIMDSARIGKWQESPERYRECTYEKALQYVGVSR